MTRLGRLAEALLEAGWLATVLLVPLFIDKNGSEVFEPAKAGVLRALAVLMLVAWATKRLSAPARHANQTAGDATSATRLFLLLRVPLIAASALVLLTVLLSTSLSVAPSESFWGHHGRAQGLLTLLAQLAIFAATAANLSSRQQLRRVVSVLVLPTLPIALYALYQRFGFEPLSITARETEIQRATSLLGQPVFLGAYLSMVMPFAVLGLVETFREHKASQARRSLSLSLYGGLLALQAAAALVSESRGPLFGLAAAAVIGFLAIAATHGWRRQLLILPALALVGALVVASGLPQRMLHGAAGSEQARVAERARDAFQVDGGGAQFRVVNWKVAARVVQSRAAIELADGSRDAHPGLRLLVGYGPEVQHGISPPFYDAELPKVFGYFLTDRYHNDLWDALVTTGLFGLASWLFLQSALIWLLCRGLGLVASLARARLFWLAYAGGALAGALAWLSMRGLPFIFLGLQMGCVVGLMLFLTGCALQSREAAPPRALHEGLLIAGLGALVSHLIEASFSFTVIATGALFWLLCALALVCVHFRRGEEAEGEPASRARANAPIVIARPFADAVADGALLALALLPLGFAFLGGATLPNRPGRVIWEALSTLSQPEGAHKPVVAIIVGATLLFGTLLLALSPGREASVATAFRARWIFASASLLGLACWLRLAFITASFAQPISSRSAVVADNIAGRAQATSAFYVCCLLLALLIAVCKSNLGDAFAARGVETAGWRLLMVAGCAVLGYFAVDRYSLRPASADAALALGSAFDQRNQMAFAEEAYERAAELQPTVAVYPAELGKAYAKHARLDPKQADTWFQRADQSMLDAIARSRVAGENATNLAVIHGNWAQRASPSVRAHIRSGVPELYQRALRLNPQDPALWRLWARTQLVVLHDAPAALVSAQRARSIDREPAGALALVGDCHVALAKGETGAARRASYLEAAASYRQAAELAPAQAQYRASEGNAYLEAGEPAKAVASLRTALSALPSPSPVHTAAAAVLQRAESAVASIATPVAGP